jgi:hypothetical protein
MKKFITILILALSSVAAFAHNPEGVKAHYNGGTLALKQNTELTVVVTGSSIDLFKGHDSVASILPAQVSALAVGADIFKRGGADVALALASPLLFLASGKHNEEYISLSWTDGASKNGVVLKLDPDKYRGLLLALQTVTGKSPVDTGAQQQR